MNCSICSSTNGREVVFSCLHAFDICPRCSALDMYHGYCAACQFDEQEDEPEIIEETNLKEENHHESEAEEDDAKNLDAWLKDRIARDDRNDDTAIVKYAEPTVITNGYEELSDEQLKLHAGDVVYLCICGVCTKAPTQSKTKPYGRIKSIARQSRHVMATIEWDDGEGTADSKHCSDEKLTDLKPVKSGFAIGDHVCKFMINRYKMPEPGEKDPPGIIIEIIPSITNEIGVEWNLKSMTERKYHPRQDLMLINKVKITPLPLVCDGCHRTRCLCEGVE